MSLGPTGKNQDIFQTLKIVFITAYGADIDEMQYFLLHFIWIITVCQSTCLGFTTAK